MGSSIYALRDAEWGDIEFLVGVRISIRQSGEPFNWNEMVKGEKDTFKPGAIQIIQRQGRDIGRFRVEHQTKRVYVGAIQVVPAYQSLGIGSAMFADLIAESNRTRLPIELEVFIKNCGARRFYDRLKFIESGRCEDKGIIFLGKDPA